MENSKQGEPTFPTPILVGSGTRADEATNFLLTALDWAFREDELNLLYPIEGEISQWIKEMWVKPVQLDRASCQAKGEPLVHGETLREALAMFADPRKEEEKRLAELMGKIPSDTIRKLTAAFEADVTVRVNEARAEIVEKLNPLIKKELTPGLVYAFASMVGRGRACLATGRCLILHKSHPSVLIDRARQGDKRAVLDLIKVDKLFLSDSCSAPVIRQAEFRNDRPFLKQLAKAIAYKPRLGWKKGCRLYLYMIFAVTPQLPALPILHLRVDPEGTRFKTSAAFERFVERCREDFDRIQAEVAGRSGEN